MGAQVFECHRPQLPTSSNQYFTGTVVSRLGGVGLDVIAKRKRPTRHAQGVSGPHHVASAPTVELDQGGEYQWRREGEYHLFNPDTVFKLQHATRAGRYDVFKEYTSSRQRSV